MNNHRLCRWCHQRFRPNPRLGKRQKCCGQPDCKRKQKYHCHSRWKSKNKKLHLANQKDWRMAHPGYWKNYRATHPRYTANNRAQTKIRKSLSVKKTGLQKRIDILQLHEKQTLFWNIRRFAKSPRSLVPLLYARSLGNRSHLNERPP